MLFILRGEERGPVYPGYKDLVASALQNNWSVCESIRVCESLSDHESIAETDYCNTEFGNVDTLVALVFITTELCLQLGNKIRAAYPHALIVGLEASSGSVAGTVGCDLYITDFPKAGLVQFLTHAEHYWKSQQLIALHFADLGLKRKQITQLTDIGLALGAQVEPDKLLETILTEARAIANCDAGSLYLVDKSADEPMLVFKLAQNDSIKVKFQETQIRLSDQSIAGYVALSGEELRIADAYQIRSSERYVFNRGFDQNYGYRSQSIVTLPMRDHRGQVTGVIQFINKKSSDGEIIEFDTETIDMLRAIVSQAAIAIQKTNLL
ncbi:MAG: GAF domain-containing protein, partial [Pseudomonadales bacterium]|nr:GAF domain-containing protein [Pseudomonadales bacterium]